MYYLQTVRVVDKEVDDRRTVMVTNNLYDVVDTALNNKADIYERGFYQYAVIQKISEGLYPEWEDLLWFQYWDESCDAELIKPKDYCIPAIG